MSYKTSMVCSGVSGWLRLTLSTSRPKALQQPTTVFVITPWRAFKLVLTHMSWRTLSMSASQPRYWFPAEDLGSDDKHCLGVLARIGDEQVDWVENSCDRFRTIMGQRLTEQDKAALAELNLDAAPTLPLPDPTAVGRMGLQD